MRKEISERNACHRKFRDADIHFFACKLNGFIHIVNTQMFAYQT